MLKDRERERENVARSFDELSLSHYMVLHVE